MYVTFVLKKGQIDMLLSTCTYVRNALGWVFGAVLKLLLGIYIPYQSAWVASRVLQLQPVSCSHTLEVSR